MAHMDMDMGGGIHGMDGMHNMDGTVEMDGMDHDMHGTDMSSGMDMHGAHGGMDMMGGMHGMHMMGNSSMHMMMMVRQPLALHAYPSRFEACSRAVCLCATYGAYAYHAKICTWYVCILQYCNPYTMFQDYKVVQHINLQ